MRRNIYGVYIFLEIARSRTLCFGYNTFGCKESRRVAVIEYLPKMRQNGIRIYKLGLLLPLEWIYPLLFVSYFVCVVG